MFVMFLLYRLKRRISCKPFLRCLVLSIMIASSFATSISNAADGYIRFSGAIVNPTCGSTEIDMNFRGSTLGRDMTCTRSNNVREASSAHYIMDVQQVQASEVPLLRYFIRYVQEDGGTVTLVTKTYK
jgi:hypothetical protein